MIAPHKRFYIKYDGQPTGHWRWAGNLSEAKRICNELKELYGVNSKVYSSESGEVVYHG